jgi:hypothetical protein
MCVGSGRRLGPHHYVRDVVREKGLWIMQAGVRGRVFRRSLRWWGVAMVGGLLCCLVFAAGAVAAMGDATTESGEGCPNEASPGFRFYLPDCRAYEQVTPVFKDGTGLTGPSVSEDGSRLIANSLGVFAGSGSDTETHGSAYQLSRSPSGWGVAGISPPASSFPAQQLLAASPDLAETLWAARPPSESLAAENLYLRESDGAMTEIGPFLPSSAAAGPPAGESEAFLDVKQLKFVESSDDFSHVLFDILSGHESGLSWPGDTTTEVRSLYEYSGRGLSHPELVGVNDEGHLISSCETYLGSPTEQELYNAVSADGESVFFTAKACSNHAGEPAVNELYARLGGFPIDTVPVSEPTFGACEECQTGFATTKHPAVLEAPAEFAGASRDGSNVFFLTTQELFAGDTGENLYDYDFDNPEGHKVVRVSTGSAAPEVQGVARVSEDGSHTYFVAGGVLTKGPREGEGGKCIAELSSAEGIEEEEAGVEEEKEEPVTVGARCRPKQGADNLYVFERDASYPAGRVAFVAALCSGEGKSGSLAGVSECPSPSFTDTIDWMASDSRPVQATPDGQFLVFQSVGDLTGGDASAVPQIFEYDATSEALVRVSRGSTSYEPQGSESADAHPSTIYEQHYGNEDVSPAGTSTSLSVSADGSTVVFASSAALTAEALPASEASAGAPVNENWNIYEYRSAVSDGGSIAAGDVYLISDGVNSSAVHLLGLSASSDDVFFTTADRLVPQDTDTQYDIYDARSDGGFAAPDPSAVCDSCEAAPLAQPLMVVSPEPATGPSAGNSVPAISKPAVNAGKTAAQIRAKKLARALRACARDRSRRKRTMCEKRARHNYGRSK